MVRSVFFKCQPDNDRVRDAELGLREDPALVSVISGADGGIPWQSVSERGAPRAARALQTADVEEALRVLLGEVKGTCEGLERSSEHLLSR